MSTPSGYRRWCEIVGLDPFHPETWKPQDHRAYQEWKLILFRVKWMLYRQQGMPDLIRAQSGRQALINVVKRDLRDALAPLIRNPWLICPCHLQRLGTGKPETEPWQEREDYLDGLPLRQRLLVWLETEFS